MQQKKSGESKRKDGVIQNISKIKKPILVEEENGVLLESTLDFMHIYPIKEGRIFDKEEVIKIGQKLIYTEFGGIEEAIEKAIEEGSKVGCNLVSIIECPKWSYSDTNSYFNTNYDKTYIANFYFLNKK